MAPRANAIMERWFGSLRRERLDRLLIVGRRHVVRVLHDYVEHYNTHRPHRSRPSAGVDQPLTRS
jgi:putative transposase